MSTFKFNELLELNSSKKDKYISREFGIFSEEIVTIWCNNPKSDYVNLGRPTFYLDGNKTLTIDFALKNRQGEVFVAEQKCELQYEKYKYLTLDSISQVQRHLKKSAFKVFVETAQNPNRHLVKVNKKPVLVSGSILVWGRVNETKKSEIINEFKFKDILSIENIINDLIEWQDQNYIDYLSMIKNWHNQLFASISGGEV